MKKNLSILFLLISITFSFAKSIDVTAQQVFANIEWATKNGVVLEKIENVSFVDKAGTQKNGVLEIIKQEDGKLGVKIGGVKFIAKTGEELKTYLNTLSDLPKGITYEGKMYRNIPHHEPAYDPRFIMRTPTSDVDNRFISGLYLSEKKSGNVFEAIHYNGGTANRDLFEFSNVKIENLLDLSNEQNLEKLGTTLDNMMLTNTKNDYEFTNVIAKWAKEKGYNGVKFKGARGNGEDYINFVIFEETTVSKSLSNYKNIDWE